jgi:hypothetical protein
MSVACHSQEHRRLPSRSAICRDAARTHWHAGVSWSIYKEARPLSSY